MFLHWFLLFSVCLAATMSPGPSFLLTLRNSLAHNRRIGIWTAVGLGFGEIPAILLIIFGLAALLTQSHIAFVTVRVVGAGYLLYLGAGSLMGKDKKLVEAETLTPPPLTVAEAFGQGVITNMTNPKGWLYFVALFSQFIGPETTIPVRLLYGATSFTVEIAWFSFVATILNIPRVKATFGLFISVIKKICGVLFIGLGLRLLVALAQG